MFVVVVVVVVVVVDPSRPGSLAAGREDRGTRTEDRGRLSLEPLPRDLLGALGARRRLVPVRCVILESRRSEPAVHPSRPRFPHGVHAAVFVQGTGRSAGSPSK